MSTIESTVFGTTKNGEEAHLYHLKNGNGMSADISDFGTLIVRLNVPDKTGAPVDVVLGYDELAQYEVNPCCFGALVGRHANRIKGARFELDGQEYKLVDTEKGNNLHSGPNMWFKRMWELVRAEQYTEAQDGTEALIELRLLSPDGDQGFPGAFDIHVTYELLSNNALRCTYAGTPSKNTVVNITHHSFFNLNGHSSGCALDHILQVDADSYTACDDDLCPNGEIVDIAGTPLDLREPTTLRPGVESSYHALANAKGYDQNFILPKTGPSAEGYLCEPRHAATLTGDKTGITCEVTTDTPGIQIYSANYVGAEKGKEGAVYHDWDAVCMETNFAANAINIPSFDQPVFGPERPYKSTTSFKFSY